MGDKKSETKKPDLRDHLPGREPAEVTNAEFVGTPPASVNNEPGAPKAPAGQTTQG